MNLGKQAESKENLCEHLEEHRKMSNSQLEFVKTKLGQTNLISSNDSVAGLVLEEDAGDVICLYFRKAFQAVCHDILISTLGNSSVLQFGSTWRGIINGSLSGRDESTRGLLIRYNLIFQLTSRMMEEGRCLLDLQRALPPGKATSTLEGMKPNLQTKT